MKQLVFGLVIFLGMHSVSILAADFRNRMAEKSELGWKGVYSLVSLLGLVLIIKGYAEVRLQPTLLYATPLWLRHVSALLMLPFFVFFLAPYFPGVIKNKLKHPQLIAVKLWAVAHLLVNGMVHDVVLFGGFLAWAVIDRISMKRRVTRPVPGMPASKSNDYILIVLGTAMYLVFTFWLHQSLIGVAPFTSGIS